MEQIEITEGVICTDPCYKPDTWCHCVLRDVKPGTWEVAVEERDIQLWGHRITGLRIKHKDYKSKMTNELLSPAIGVDSGQCGFFDIDYFIRHKEDKEEENRWYNRVCDKTLAKPFYGTIDGRGVVSESGYGDGAYDLYGRRNKKGELVELRVVFITENGNY